jgi:imidazole glycerol-phosphate synthase subunit HisF
MLKFRIIASIVFNGKTIVRGEDFINNRPSGSLIQQVKIYSLRGVDELIVYNTSGSMITMRDMDNIAKNCFMPLSIGGGIRKISDIEFLLTNGADKVVLNSCIQDHAFIKKAVEVFGAQAISIGIDFKNQNGILSQYTNNGSFKINSNPENTVIIAENIGVGEVIINSIDHDGRQLGYNIDDTISIAKNTKLPVIISGGAGKPDDFYNALSSGKISAVCASSVYLFSKHTPLSVKKYLESKNILVRKPY